MKHRKDELFDLFERHLHAGLSEDESSEEFTEKVVQGYLKSFSEQAIITTEHRAVIEADLKEEVVEMLRKKTYGHFSLSTYRQNVLQLNPAKKNEKSLALSEKESVVDRTKEKPTRIKSIKAASPQSNGRKEIKNDGFDFPEAIFPARKSKRSC